MKQPQNPGQNRKSEAQKAFEDAENTRRFAADNSDSRGSRERTIENIRQDRNSRIQNREQQDNSNAQARRDEAQSHDYKGESQNVNDDSSRPLSGGELQHARNKAREGKKGDERIS